VIKVDGLTVEYGAVRALRDVSFEAKTGVITAVLGANGAGKTTLLRAISGLKAPSSGSVFINEHKITGMKTEDIARHGVGHVPEGRGVINEFTVEENLRIGGLARRVDIAAGLKEQYEHFPVLGERRRQYASTLSGGERQMLAMARAMIAKPSILLLDEPSLGLAPLVTAELMGTIGQLCRSAQLTVLLVEQNAKSALKIAQDAIVLHVGSIVACADAQTVGADEQLRHYYLGTVH
jgi:branched-chain amino acid transport system ATP-binding protein